LLTIVLLVSLNFHQIAIKILLDFAMASCKSVECTMLYLSEVDSVKCPEIFMAILRGTLTELDS
jgi:hypothetical protein